MVDDQDLRRSVFVFLQCEVRLQGPVVTWSWAILVRCGKDRTHGRVTPGPFRMRAGCGLDYKSMSGLYP